MKARFAITVSWPINTEPPGSMHIKDKATANSIIFLVCGSGAGPRREGAFRTNRDQAALAAVFDLQGTRSSPSFDKLWRDVKALLGAAR